MRFLAGARSESASSADKFVERSQAGEGGLSARELVRKQLMEDIGEFLLGNDLEISEANLSAALGLCSGNDIGLANRVAERRAKGLPIDQAWLDEQRKNGDEAINRISDKLERTLESFAETSRSARDTAAQYNTEMQAQVDKVDSGDDREEIRNLAAVAMAMIERTRHLEQEMRRSESEADSLRVSLAKARRDAEHDHLTGLPNRRAFEGLLERHFREAQQELDALSVAFCDIDHFKKINDTHGHDAGDRVLQAVAATLAKITDDNCHVARHGGEEFVMLFRGLGKTAAKEKLDSVREVFARRKFVNRRTDEPIGTITFSGGVADVFAYPTTRDALKAADIALYSAKEQGRNQIVAA
ncbi:diguanylate cyclase [Novosphingobium sp. PY1]|uniref:GGDEF domain-containing protein n=1 Tax=Novosphingobium sp. PY1 TaxID=1882221 RepID=UPI001A8D546C|nr:GGDEF domain-containing protein [Novosphingobium sp. PY1]